MLNFHSILAIFLNSIIRLSSKIGSQLGKYKNGPLDFIKLVGLIYKVTEKILQIATKTRDLTRPPVIFAASEKKKLKMNKKSIQSPDRSRTLSIYISEAIKIARSRRGLGKRRGSIYGLQNERKEEE